MRNILIVFAVALMFTACNNNQDKTETTRDVVGVPDSTLYKSNTLTDTGNFTEPPLATPPTTTAKTSKPARVPATPKKTTRSTKPASSNAPATESQAGTANAGNPTDTIATTTAPTETKKDKGWSNAAKGATIGGVGGAIGGAIISKKKGKGALIGGAIGAAGGYILGRKKDKKAAEAAADTTK